MHEEHKNSAVRHNEGEHRFEVEAGNGLALLEYTRKPGRLALNHTEVPPEVEGRGTGGALVQAALEYARQKGLEVEPLCPFVAHYLQGHPEYRDVIAPQYREQLSKLAQ